ncbi:MAG TPA: glycoside hydrolase family 3 N-terminal domain-containing protein [Thermoanaerobaculia bacterium]|nr:glycoside hydrolase family 3 N-terminal domain-containing protein [Thermoanaerobaculia bacterium]
MKRIVLSCLLIFGCATVTASDRWVERTLRSMTIDEKIGQMLMARSGPGNFRALDSDDLKQVRRAISEFHVGSLHAGIGEASTIAVTLNELQRLAKVPLLTAANLEGGAGYVLYGATRMPLAMSIAATGDDRLAYEAARVTAREGRAAGVNVNFYPVADVNNNPANPIINIRSFGEDPATVSRFVAAYVRGTQDNGQIATAKHFPGHGDVATDSHLQMPVLDVTPQRLQSIELPPFRSAIDAGVEAVMTAHIWLPQLEAEKGIPATLSKPILQTLLRDDLRFQGIVFTDSMGMRGVSAAFSNEDATLRAVEAGADILVTPPDVEASFRTLRDAVRSGRISEKRLDDSVRRILTAKARLGLNKPQNRLVDVNALMQKVGTAANREVAQRIADNAITLVKDERNVLPLRPSSELRVVQINVLDTRSGWREGPVGRIVAAELPKRFPRAVTVTIDDQTTPTEYELVRKLAQMADALVVNTFIRVASYKGSIELNREQLDLLRDLIRMKKKPLVLNAFGSPFLLNVVPELPAYAVTYDISGTAEVAAVKTLSGEIPYKGRLPINLSDAYRIGHGLTQ